MTVRWAARLSLDASHRAAVLRLEEGVEVHEDPDHLWLRGESIDPSAAPVRKLLDAALFEVLPDGQLRPWSSRLPCGRLPEGQWSPIFDRFPVELPVPRMGCGGISRIRVSLRHSSAFEAANLLIARGVDWLAYATSAPQWRLDRLRFAAAVDGRILIRGEPLPPLAGARHYEQSGVALPCGWQWPAGIDAAMISAALGLESGELALFSSTGAWERLTADDFVRAGRSAVRLTVLGDQDGRDV